MRILGIDPGVAIVGFGLIESDRGSLRMLQYGAITTPAGQPLAARLLQISRDMEELIQSFQPDEMSIEELFFPKYHHGHRRGPCQRGHPLCGREAQAAHL